jgi:hypothetical protein
MFRARVRPSRFALALDAGRLWRILAARGYSRMLLTRNDGRLARPVDKLRFVGPHCSAQSGIVSRRDDATVGWDQVDARHDGEPAKRWSGLPPQCRRPSWLALESNPKTLSGKLRGASHFPCLPTETLNRTYGSSGQAMADRTRSGACKHWQIFYSCRRHRRSRAGQLYFRYPNKPLTLKTVTVAP